MSDKIDTRLVQIFEDRFRIVSRSKSGKIMISPAKKFEIEEEVARH